MNLPAYLANKAPTESSPAPLMLLPDWVVTRPSPSKDEPDEPVLETLDQTIELDEIFCLIDYIDANQCETHRRITMRSIAPGPNGPILKAVCHERRAIRHFRCDRIKWIYDTDGVVEDTETFFRETMLIDIGANESSGTNRDDRISQFREQLRPAVSILILLAKSDGDFHQEELDVIFQYIETEAVFNKAKDYDITLDDLSAINSAVCKLRPHRGSTLNYLKKVIQFDKDRYNRFKKYVVKLVAADGMLAKAEEEFLLDLDWHYSEANR